MSIQRGDVVLIDAPFVTRPGGKIRPLLVVQNNANNRRMQNTIGATFRRIRSVRTKRPKFLLRLARPSAGRAVS
jgi:mRNA-degrading endonuclease toxin of MazEF toxin-antitoxin module